jgi:hypothetical protein
MEVHNSRWYRTSAVLWLVLPAVSSALDVVHINLSLLTDEAARIALPHEGALAAGDNT